MMVLITYDVDYTQSSGAKRLRKVAKICEKYGVRVQNSVFEMLVDTVQLTQIKAALSDTIDQAHDSIRFYRLGNHWDTKVEIMGLEKGFRQDEPLLL